MSARRIAHRSARARRERFVHLCAEILEDRRVLSAASATSTLAPPESVPQDTGDTGVYLYTPQQIQDAYGITGIRFDETPGDGRGQTIAIIDSYDDPNLVDSSSPNFSTSDLAEFDRAFGLPDPPSFTKYNETGQTTNLPGTGTIGPGASSYQVEEAIDVEWAHAIAPEASIDLIECSANTALDYYTGAMTAAGLPGVSVVSMSTGAPEWSGELSDDQDFTTPAGHQGVTFLASSGDHGSPASYPATSPNVVAVGGTSLFLNPDGSYSSEVGWSKGSNPHDATSASGGGTSAYEPVPGYQDGINSITDPLTGRATPDVSIEADPTTSVAVYDSYDYGADTPWTGGAGTSVSAPMWAGLIAIANEGRALQGEPTLNGSSDPTQTLSALYSLPATDFHPITVGDNGGYTAGPGYNEVTGLGSPVADLLVPDLAAYGEGSQLFVMDYPSSVAYGQAFDVQVAAVDSEGRTDYSYDGSVTLSGPALNGQSVTVSAVDGVATFEGLSINPGSDVLSASAEGMQGASTAVSGLDGSIPQGYARVQIQSAYSINEPYGVNQLEFGTTPGTGAGQTIAIIDPYDDPNIAGDVAQFDAMNDLPAIDLTVVNEQGDASPLPGTDPTETSEFEEALDVEWTHAIAPGASVLLVECTTNADSDIFQGAMNAAAMPGVSVILMSLPGDEFSSETSFDSDFTTPAGHEGVTFVTSVGQYESVGQNANGAYAASSPNVIGVGGTSLFLDRGNSDLDETAWSYDDGGKSPYETEPSYQDGVQTTGQRTVPDVSFDADPNTGIEIYNSFGNADAPVGVDGYTDFAAAAWAALFAIADQGSVDEGGTTLNSGSTGADPHSAQWALYSAPYTDYHDVTTGGNGSINAGPGYDALTGLGTPIVNQLIPDLAAYGNATHLAVMQEPFRTITSGNPFTLIVSAEDSSGGVDSSYDGSVTLTLPADAGTVTATAIDGVARFTNLEIYPTGTDDTIQATAAGLTQTETAPFDIVAPGATTTALSSPPGSSTYGKSVTFTATVEDANIGLPTGSVEFYDGAADLGPGTFGSGNGNSATWTLETSALPAGSDSIEAVFTATGGFLSSTGKMTQTVDPVVLTVTGLTASSRAYNGGRLDSINAAGAMLSGVLDGDSVTLSATGASGTFASKDVGNGIRVAVSGLTLTGPQAGDYTLALVATTANITPATLTVAGITAANKVYDASETAVLNTAGARLVGVFDDDSVALDTAGAGGTFASASVGNDITVVISGLTIGGPQAGDYTLKQPTTSANITPAVPAVRLSTLGGTSFDSAPSVAAIVTGLNAQPAPELEGAAPRIVYYEGSTASGTPLSGAPTAAGTYTVVAVFPGSADYRANQSAPETYTLVEPTTTITTATTLTSSSDSTVFGQSVTLMARVEESDGLIASGDVTFSDGGSVLGSAAIDASGTATFTNTTIAVGAHSIVASYSGGIGNSGSTSATAALIVNPDPTQIVLVPRPVMKKRKVVSLGLEATIRPLAPGGGIATGVVTFEVVPKTKKATAKTLGTASLVGGVATLAVKPSRLIKKTIAVLYDGDTDFTSSQVRSPILTRSAPKNRARPTTIRHRRG